MFSNPIGSATPSSAIRSAASGIERAHANIARAASGLAGQTDVEPAHLAAHAVAILEARSQLQASANVLTTTDRMPRTLLDLGA